jgi:hypothetical protein
MTAIQELMFSSQRWYSLVGYPCSASNSTVNQLFLAYSDNLKNENSLEDRRLCIVMRRSIRDLYMTYTITQDFERAEEIRELATLLEGIDIELFEDLDEMMQLPFDVRWIPKIHVLSFLNRTNQKLSSKAVEVLNNLPDHLGDRIEDMSLLHPLQQYRALHLLQNIIDTDYSQVFTDPSVSDPCSLLCENTTNYTPAAYYSFIISHHQKLTDSIQNMYKEIISDQIEEKSDFTARKMVKWLSSTNPEKSSIMVQCLDIIRSNVHPSYFPILSSSELAVPSRLSLTILEPSLDISKKAKIKQQLLEISQAYSLSSKQSNRLKSYRLAETLALHQKSPVKCMALLYQMLIAQYKHSESSESFLHSAPPLAHHINLNFERIKRKSIKVDHALTQLFKGKLSTKEIKAVIDDLSDQCVSFYRLIASNDLCPNLKEFLNESNADSDSILANPSQDSERKMIKCDSYIPSLWDEMIDIQNILRMSQEEIRNIDPVRKSASEMLIDLGIHLSEAVVYYILTAQNDVAAKTVIENALLLAVCSLKAPITNYHIARSIYFGFQYSAISRLKHLFESLSPTSLTHLNQLNNLFLMKKNNYNYRKAMEMSDRPYIPHIGLIKSDLAFATESDSTEEQQKLVRNLVDDYRKVRALMKFALPLRPHKTDIVATLADSLIQTSLPKPQYKIDIENIEEKWKRGEWEYLPKDEKIYYVSRFKWQGPLRKKS